MLKFYLQLTKAILMATVLTVIFTSGGYSQPCISPVKKIILYDAAGNYYVYWKPASPPPVINFTVRIQCTNLPPCLINVNVTSSNVLHMNGGWLGAKIPALPSVNSTAKASILPPNCSPEFSPINLRALDLITDNLDIISATCDSDTCKLSFNNWKTLSNLTAYANSKCGGAGAVAAPSVVTAVDAPIQISLRKNANGKWQMRTVDTLVCDSCYVFNFQITCLGVVYFVMDTICFNYTGPNIGCRQSLDLKDMPIVLFPNPAGNFSTLEFALSQPAVVSIAVFNSLGKVVSTICLNQQFDAGSEHVQLSLTDFAPGIYIIEYRTGTDIQRIKLLKF